MISTTTRSILLIQSALFLLGCQSTTPSFTSPSGNLRFRHLESDGGASKYLLMDRKAGVIGTVPSIIDKESVRNVKGLPNAQSVAWSDSEKTIVIHEDMSDASPDYNYKLLIQNESGNYDLHDIKPPIRGLSIHNLYGHTPNVGKVTDSHVEFLWLAEPKKELLSIGEIIAGQNPQSRLP